MSTWRRKNTAWACTEEYAVMQLKILDYLEANPNSWFSGNELFLKFQDMADKELLYDLLWYMTYKSRVIKERRVETYGTKCFFKYKIK